MRFPTSNREEALQRLERSISVLEDRLPVASDDELATRYQSFVRLCYLFEEFYVPCPETEDYWVRLLALPFEVQVFIRYRVED